MVVYRRDTRRRPMLVLLVVTSLALITLDTGRQRRHRVGAPARRAT